MRLSDFSTQACGPDGRHHRHAYSIEAYRGSRHWAVYDQQGELVCVTVYKRGATEVVRRLEAKAG